jgi:hypothetical protein
MRALRANTTNTMSAGLFRRQNRPGRRVAPAAVLVSMVVAQAQRCSSRRNTVFAHALRIGWGWPGERGAPASDAFGLSRASGGAGAAPRATLAALDGTENDDAARLEQLGKANAGLFR